MKKILIYYNFILITILTLWGFIDASSPYQIISSILLYPLFIYFTLQVLPKRQSRVVLPKVEPVELTKEEIEPAPKMSVDVDRRMFLKLIGSAGIALFLFSIFTKRFETNFFGKAQPQLDTVSIKDSEGNKINPAEKQPTDGYRISELDDSIITYFGYTKNNGAWFIMREDEQGSFRYVKGSANFSRYWKDREALAYDYFENTF